MILQNKNLKQVLLVTIFCFCFGCTNKTETGNATTSPSATASQTSIIEYSKDISMMHIYDISLADNEPSQDFQVTVSFYTNGKWSLENSSVYKYEENEPLAVGLSKQSAEISYGEKEFHSVPFLSEFMHEEDVDTWSFKNMEKSKLSSDKDVMLVFLSVNCTVPQSDVFENWRSFEGNRAIAISIKLV